MEDLWLSWAKRLQAIASTGAHFCRDPYDEERYREVSAIANAMLGRLGDVPIARIEALVPDHAQGYVTPRVDVRGALIENGAVLLVRERSDGLWTLPGGYADVGISPRNNVAKEIREEAGIDVRVERLYALRHKARHDYDPDTRDFYKLLFLCARDDATRPEPGMETLEARFFRPDALPPLSRGRVVPADIEAAFEYLADPARPPSVD